MALAYRDRLKVLGLTAVCGNISVQSTAANALKVLSLAKREDVPVFLGAAAPLVSQLVTAETLHGVEITKGWDLPASNAAPRPDCAPDWMIETILSHPPGSVTICALRPLNKRGPCFCEAPRDC